MSSIKSHLIDIGYIKQPINSEYSSQSKATTTNDYSSLVKQRAENRLLNTQAHIEYALLKSRIVMGTLELNKFLDLDDQISVQEYKSCSSIRYRQQFFVMDFKQLPIDDSESNHALDLVFQGSDRHSDASGRATLVLAREFNQFVWRQLHSVSGGPCGPSKVVANLVLRWLQNEPSLFVRFAPV